MHVFSGVVEKTLDRGINVYCISSDKFSLSIELFNFNLMFYLKEGDKLKVEVKKIPKIYNKHTYTLPKRAMFQNVAQHTNFKNEKQLGVWTDGIMVCSKTELENNSCYDIVIEKI